MRRHSVFERSVFLLAYGLLHRQLEQFLGTKEGRRRLLDVYAGSEQGSGCAPLHGRPRFEVVVDVLYAVDSAYAANRALRSWYMAESHIFQRLIYTKQTVYEFYKCLIRVLHLISLPLVQWHFLAISVNTAVIAITRQSRSLPSSLTSSL